MRPHAVLNRPAFLFRAANHPINLDAAGCPVRCVDSLFIAYYLRMNADNKREPIADDQVALVVEVFRMLADPTRVQVLWALVEQELSVNELADHVSKPAPSVSQHLAKLRMARLVRTRREGTTIFYSLENDHVRQLVTDAVFNAEHAGPGIPEHHRSHSTRRITTRTAR